MESTVSIIIPVYKVEKYIRRCLESVLAQTYPCWEAILVDDGSPDNCGTICEEYAAKDSRIHVIHRENGGLSAARNTGIEWAFCNSCSQYLTFVDSDDWISPEYLLQLMNSIEEKAADVVVSKLLAFEDGEEISFNADVPNSICCLSGREACVHYYEMRWTIPIAACAKLYKKSLFENIRFPEGRVYEDQGTVPMLWYKANKVAIIENRPLYAYRIVQNSISHSAFSARKYDDVWNVQRCENFFSQRNDTEMKILCERFRKILCAKYIVLSHHHDMQDEIPVQYNMTLLKALWILRKEIQDHTYTWYLSQVYPNLAKPHSYIRKIEEVLGVAKTGK